MKLSVQLALAAASLSLMGAGAASADTILHYSFDPGSFYNYDGSNNTPTGSFDYDTTTSVLSNVDYTRGSDHFTTGSIYNDTSEVYFGPFGTSDYDVYQFANSLADGGTDVITQGYHPAIVIDAGGSVTSASAGGIPEPATWALMLVGFGGLGAAMRAHRRADRDLAALKA
jgi:hypothetical protein